MVKLHIHKWTVRFTSQQNYCWVECSICHKVTGADSIKVPGLKVHLARMSNDKEAFGDMPQCMIGSSQTDVWRVTNRWQHVTCGNCLRSKQYHKMRARHA